MDVRLKNAKADVEDIPFIGKDGKQREIQNLKRYLFDKIVSNDINWENYALAIVIGLVYGGVEDGELGEVEE